MAPNDYNAPDLVYGDDNMGNCPRGILGYSPPPKKRSFTPPPWVNRGRSDHHSQNRRCRR